MQALAAEIPITLADGTVWLSIGQGLLAGAVFLFFGIWVARTVGLLRSEAPAGEIIGVGLASGALVLTSWWAALASGGRSSFTPVAIGFAIAIGTAVVRRLNRADRPRLDTGPDSVTAEAAEARSVHRKRLMLAILGGGVFVVAVALFYGSTLTLSPRGDAQPIEFRDEAYYAVLGADLAKSGTESLYSPSGFAQINGLPNQTWYHWGELWLEAAAITIFGMAPQGARDFLVLPVLLLAAAAMTGTLVRRLTGVDSPGAFAFGFLVCLFLAPVAVIAGPFFSSWAVGLIFGITTYGLAAVAVLLAMYAFAVLGDRPPSWPLAAFVGSGAALILPAHVVVAVLAIIGLGGVWAIRVGQALAATGRLPVIAPIWRRVYLVAGFTAFATVAWGVATGHGIGTSGLSPSVTPFNESWRASVAITVVCSGAFYAVAIAWYLVRAQRSIEAGLYLAVAIILFAGAIIWGARLGDFTLFHLFFAGLAVFATPAAAVAVWSLWLRLRATDHGRLAVVLLLVCVTQLEVGFGLAVVRLVNFGPGRALPVPMPLLTAIRHLPSDAKLAYACRPSDEVAFWSAELLGIDAHTGRRIIPMCFQPESFGLLTGTRVSADTPSPLFQWAPQRAIYPDSAAKPSPEIVSAFLKSNGVNYIYVDAMHPNTLVPNASPIATVGATQVLRLP